MWVSTKDEPLVGGNRADVRLIPQIDDFLPPTANARNWFRLGSVFHLFPYREQLFAYPPPVCLVNEPELFTGTESFLGKAKLLRLTRAMLCEWKLLLKAENRFSSLAGESEANWMAYSVNWRREREFTSFVLVVRAFVRENISEGWGRRYDSVLNQRSALCNLSSSLWLAKLSGIGVNFPCHAAAHFQPFFLH